MITKDRDFLLLWAGNGISQFGDRIQQIALVWWALEKGGALGAVSTALLVSTLPAVVIGIFAGAAVDRYDRRWLMIISAVLRAVIIGAVAYAAWIDHLTFSWLLIATAAVSALGAFFSPAAMAAIPDLVPEEDLLKANSWQEMTIQIAMIGGPALGGMLIAAFGTPAAFGVNGLALLLCGLILFAMRLTRKIPAPHESGWSQLLGGFQVLREDRTVRTLLILFAVINFFLVPIAVFLPYYAKDVFLVGASGLGALEASIGIGMLLGALALARVGEVQRRRRAVLWGLMTPGICLAGMGLFPSLLTFLAALAILGFALSVVNIVALTHFQQVVPGDKLGRFMGLLMTVVMALMPLSFAVAGWSTAFISADHFLVLSGSILVLTALSVPFLRSLESLVFVRANDSPNLIGPN